jgi:hypothetical protein
LFCVTHAIREHEHADARLVVGVEYGHVLLRTGLEQGLEESSGNGGSNVGVVRQPGVCRVHICTLVGLAALLAFRCARRRGASLGWGGIATERYGCEVRGKR